MCCSLALIYAVEDSDGVKIMGATEGAVPYEITHLTNHFLPAVGCQPNYEHCELRCAVCREGEESICCTLPVLNEVGTNHLALLQLRQPSAESLQFELLDCAVITHGADCIAAQVFTSRRFGRHFVACINTTVVGDAYIWFLELSYDTNDISGTAGFPMNSRYTVFDDFDSPLSLSEILFVESTGVGCFSSTNIFFTAQGSVFTVGQKNNIFDFSDETILDCLHPLDVSYLEGNSKLLLRLQCSDYITKLFAACGSQEVVETYDSRSNGTIYQCSEMGLHANITLQDGLLNFTSSASLEDFANAMPSLSFPFAENISYGFCDVGSGVNFVFGFSNGSVFSLSLTSGKIFTLAHNSCDDSSDTYTRGHCYKARTTNIRNIIGNYDFQDSSFHLANLSCPEHSIVARIPMNPKPPLAAFVHVSGDTCACRSSSDDQTSYLPFSTMIEPSLSSTISQSVTVPSSPLPPVTSSSPPTEVSPTTMPTPVVVHRPPTNPDSKWLLALVGIPVVFILILATYICFKKYYQRKSVENGTQMALINYQGASGVNGQGDAEKEALCANGKISNPSQTTKRVEEEQTETSGRLPSCPTLQTELASSQQYAPSSNPGLLESVELERASSTIQRELASSQQYAPSSNPGLLESVEPERASSTIQRELVSSQQYAPSSNPGLLDSVEPERASSTIQRELVSSQQYAPSSNPGLLDSVEPERASSTIQRELVSSQQYAPSSNPGLLDSVEPERLSSTLQTELASSQQYAPSSNPESVEPISMETASSSQTLARPLSLPTLLVEPSAGSANVSSSESVYPEPLQDHDDRNSLQLAAPSPRGAGSGHNSPIAESACGAGNTERVSGMESPFPRHDNPAHPLHPAHPPNQPQHQPSHDPSTGQPH